ncbi:hypothetical protein CCU68_08175 [Pseudomonas gingeri NCPPB 3146 = LMG 5327]|uniref:Uncharacterized protein n=2 Tax=Pseudomonas gingeri TaxID=117681 RepID=A0A7Y8CHM4_9PSED|nr:hypothetical protein [Pseudomonas gingeri]NWC18612.1 hypothetical protein [Pseudomonas gingeri]NWE49983.1 hypothetical protein [Pseudomonas gingeri]PNQ93074.1 hypothetical protein CCU68_08175 [Pseudomonas gingeri NCPPB 3146 = LMG 5327]
MKSFEYSLKEAWRCSALFRFGRDVEAALVMVELFDGVQALLSEASSVHQQAWTRLLLLMLGCQERQDWLGLADTLQYEMIELLEAVQADR